MTNVIEFPAKERQMFMIAEDYMRHTMRQDLGECVGLMHGPLTPEKVAQICVTLKRVALELDCALGLIAACK